MQHVRGPLHARRPARVVEQVGRRDLEPGRIGPREPHERTQVVGPLRVPHGRPHARAIGEESHDAVEGHEPRAARHQDQFVVHAHLRDGLYRAVPSVRRAADRVTA